MKRHLLGLCLIAGLAVSAAPLPCSRADWAYNPLAWTFDDAAQTVRAGGFPGRFAVHEATPRSARVRISARVTPEGAVGTNGWSTLGVALVDDDHNFWHVAFVQAPQAVAGGRRFFELAEMRDGVWLAQHVDRLKTTHHRQTACWVDGAAYEVTLACTPDGISGSVKDARGAVIWEMGYAFPKPDAEGAAKAVTCGRPALQATGGFRGTFAAPDATCAEARARLEPEASFPPYTGTSFVPGVTDTATGFFRVVEKDGRWWVIDPLGRGTVLLGVDHVTYWGHHSQRTGRSLHHEANKVMFPDKADWEADTLKRLQAWGFNLLGAGCDAKLS